MRGSGGHRGELAGLLERISPTRSTTPIWLCYGPWHLRDESHITICEYNLVDLSPRGEAAGVVVGGDTETLFVFG